MNGRLEIPQRSAPTRLEDRSSLGAHSEGDEATVVQFGFEEVTIVGDVSGQDDEALLVEGLGVDGDEPTREYPRRALSRKQKRSEWYVRLRLTEERIAKLWVRRLAPLDVLVWWDDDQAWAPLLSVPEMRAAIADMRDREETRRRARHETLPPPMLAAPMQGSVPDVEPQLEGSCRVVAHRDEARHDVALQHSTWVEQWRRRVAAEARMTPAVTALISGAQRNVDPAVVLRPKEIRPPPSSLPPMVVDVAPLEIPPAPAVPQVEVSGTTAPAPVTTRAVSVAPPPPSKVQRRRLGVGSAERVLWLAAAAVLTALVLVLASRRPLTVVQPPEPSVQATRTADAPDTPEVRVGVSVGSPKPATSGSARSAESVRVESARSSKLATLASASSPRGRAARSRAKPDAKSPRVTASTSKPPGAVSASAPARPSSPAVLPPLPDAGSFDPAAARRALVSASHRVGYCGEGPLSGVVVVTFSPSGFVQNVSLARVEGENVRADCVLRAFQAVRVMPYSGRPITVSKSFRVN